ncbi:MAG: double-strand break repair helicase AddA [Sphingobium sp.]
MNRRASPLLPLRGVQATASSPDSHVWLSASAGTGKTHVLTARVFRLLLGGVPPENILCLTFTKAGASEMADRIHARLAAWVRMSDADLALDLKALGEELGPERRGRARQLFARVLEATGGGLRIRTIHSFCQQLLASFPLEAGLVPGFRALEDREQQELAREALQDMVVDAENCRDTTLLEALHALSLRLGEQDAQAYLARCTGAADVLAGLPADIGSWLFGVLGLPEGDIEAAIAEACADEVFDVDALSRVARINRDWGTSTGLGHADRIAAWLAAEPVRRAVLLDDLKTAFFTTGGDLRKIQKGQEKVDPAYGDLAAEVGEAVFALIALRARAAYARLAAQGLHAGRSFSEAYLAAKRRAGAVDYDDLIAHAAALLRSEGAAAWIRYKLDSSTDHILVDEAQDTNAYQWAIVDALADEFFAGEGAHGDQMRTLFTVGDFKQAIFGFQGTSPKSFETAREHFRQRARDVEHDFHDLSLDESFRSTPAVLEVVDATVATLGAEALGLSPQTVLHHSQNGFPGLVGLLKPVATVSGSDDTGDPPPEGEEDWLADQDRMLAERIAGQVKAWIDGGLMLQSKGRALRAGDIMILLRKRGALARLIVARLYEAGVPVAGVDRLRLQAPLGVQDLMAALRFASQPEDDLNLAGLLVSPLIGWSQDDLMDRAVPRKGSLWRHLRENSATPAADLAVLQDILAKADFVTPYRLLEHLLSGPTRGRHRLIARLGEEARDSMEELLNAALAHERKEQPSLQGFIDWFDREEGDIKREDDGNADAVRLLTVHGAKGLQAPLVILADACGDPEVRRRGSALDVRLSGDARLPLVSPRKEECWDLVEQAAIADTLIEREEHWRLLYVAMTRAEEQLYVTGALGPRAKGQIPIESWFAAVERGMSALGADWCDDPLWGAAIEWRGSVQLAPKAAEKGDAKATDDAVELPDWIFMPAPREARPPRPLAPTVRMDDDQPYPPPSPAMARAAAHGRLLHSLYERLPDVVPGERRAAADRWLEREGGLSDADERAALVDQALGIIDAPEHAELFGAGSLAEAPVAAVVGGEVVNGIIDRLVIGEDMIRIVDFKTGRQVPESTDLIPVAYLRQMAAYVAALETIFPGRRVEASLLYTAAPRLFVLDEALLAPQKPGFGV